MLCAILPVFPGAVLVHSYEWNNNGGIFIGRNSVADASETIMSTQYARHSETGPKLNLSFVAFYWGAVPRTTTIHCVPVNLNIDGDKGRKGAPETQCERQF